MNCPIIKLAQALIRCPSLSPDDAGCQSILHQRLQAVGFTVEPLPFGDTLNFWAWHGNSTPCVTLVGHTDVVPPGDLQQWQYPPFSAHLSDGMLYGRGAADMKGSLAALVVAAERFVMAYPNHPGRLALLITSDEENQGTDGTVKVVAELIRRKELIHYCLVGEPSSSAQLGDVIRNGRRGSLTGTVSIHGIQGHVAYPQDADNPIHRVLPALQQLVTTEWDQGDTFFPPTGLQIVNLQAGVGASNVIPGLLQAVFNFRYGPESDCETLKTRVCSMLDQHHLNYSVAWQHAAQPFLTPEGRLVNAVIAAIKHHTGLTPRLSTAGGTSDGRFIAPMGAEVVELGPINATIHKVNECVNVVDLQQLGTLYQHIIADLLT